MQRGILRAGHCLVAIMVHDGTTGSVDERGWESDQVPTGKEADSLAGMEESMMLLWGNELETSCMQRWPQCPSRQSQTEVLGAKR